MHGHTDTVDYFDLSIEFVFYTNKTYLYKDVLLASTG